MLGMEATRQPTPQPYDCCAVLPAARWTGGAARWQEHAMKTFFLRFFTWWNSQTFGTQFWTWAYGELVGQDEFGNRYYRTRGGKIDPTLLMERRWVIYNGVAEP